MSDSSLALTAKLHGTYDDGGPMCCKHAAMQRFLHKKGAVTVSSVCSLGGDGMWWMKLVCLARPQCASLCTFQTCKQNAAVFLLTFSSVKYIILCVISILFPVWQLIFPGLSVWKHWITYCDCELIFCFWLVLFYFSCFCSYDFWGEIAYVLV